MCLTARIGVSCCSCTVGAYALPPRLRPFLHHLMPPLMNVRWLLWWDGYCAFHFHTLTSLSVICREGRESVSAWEQHLCVAVCPSVCVSTDAFKSGALRLCRWTGRQKQATLCHTLTKAIMQIQSASINIKIICFARSVQLHNVRVESL